MNDDTQKPFYQHGLRFSCTRCSMCCRFDSGYVWLSRADLARLAGGFQPSVDDVIDRYCRVVDMGGFRHLSLQEQPNKDCVFWRDGGCSVYRTRPLQCRSYPFWAHQLIDRETWDNTAKSCPGVNVGTLHSRQEIEQILENRRSEPPLNADSIER
jgi:uncharacterized protein